MELSLATQQSPVASEVNALLALIRPVLFGIMSNIKSDVLAEAGGWANVKLKMVPRLYLEGDGDIGICFEYAVHDALFSQDPGVCSRMHDALRICGIPDGD